MHQEEKLTNKKQMSKDDFDLLKSVIQIKENPLKSWLNSICMLKEMGFKEVVNHPDFLYAEGELPLLIVCHLDTVFHYPATEVFYDRDANVMWAPGGAGFDDRAGVMICLKMFQEVRPLPSFLFCCEEEVGGEGARVATKVLADKVKDKFKYIVEVDRQGAQDCVFYNDENTEFHKYIESFGFKTAKGTFTDISYLAPGWGISAVNLSVGYLDEHTQSERLYVGCFLATYEKILKMLTSIHDSAYYKYVPKQGVPSYYTAPLDDDYESLASRTCDLCGTPLAGKHSNICCEGAHDDVTVLCDQCKALIGDDWNDDYYGYYNY